MTTRRGCDLYYILHLPSMDSEVADLIVVPDLHNLLRAGFRIRLEVFYPP